MWVSNFRAIGLAGFKDSGEIELGQGLNIFVGQNNAGKSALLSSLGHSMAGSPHRDEVEYRTARLPAPEMFLQLNFSNEEIKDIVLKSDRAFTFPTHDRSETSVRDMKSWITQDLHVVDLSRTLGSQFRLCAVPGPFWGNGAVVTASAYQGDIRFSNDLVPSQTGNTRSIRDLIQELWNSFSFHFGAQRYSIGKSPMKRETRLASNASNLPAVLHMLSGDRGSDFERLKLQVSSIFENVANLSVTSTDDDRFEIRTWPTRSMDHPDLSFSLDASGTGVAQVIAILTAAITTPAGIIVIDEVSSFLHPSAAKALMRTLQTHYPQHQYIVSTHSPDVLASGGADKVFLVKRVGYISQVQPASLAKLADLRDVFSSIGASMMDLFAADRIIWVEGETEELCFPLIAEAFNAPVAPGLLISSVLATGDFNAKRKRDRELAFELYQHLATAAAPLVKSIVFSFDKENLTDEVADRLNKEAGGRILFLPRRNYEAYLIHPKVLSEFISSRCEEANASTEQVNQWIRQHGGDVIYAAQSHWNEEIGPTDPWLKRVDGARFISDLISALSEGRLVYSKVKDGVDLTYSILKSDRMFLEELGEYAVSLFDFVLQSA